MILEDDQMPLHLIYPPWVSVMVKVIEKLSCSQKYVYMLYNQLLVVTWHVYA